MEIQLNCIFSSEKDKQAFQDLIRQYEGFKEDQISRSGRQGFYTKNQTQYNQGLPFWQILVLAITVKSLPAIISSLRDIIIKYLERSKSTITLEKGDTKLTLDTGNIDDVKKIIDESTVKKLIGSTASKRKNKDL